MKVFFAFLPRTFLGLIPVGLMIGIFFPESEALGNALINIAIFAFALRISIILYEAGHLLGARLAGGTPRELILGKGHEVYSTRFKGILITLRANFSEGLAISTFNDLPGLKARYFLSIIGGSVLTILVTTILIWLVGLDFYNAQDEFSVAPIAVLILANMITVLRNLVPHTSTTLGTQRPSDGRLLLQLPFMNRDTVRERIDAVRVYEGIIHLENHAYTRASEIFRQYLAQHPENIVLTLNLAYISLRTGQFEESLTTALPLHALLVESKISKRVAPHLYSHLAWTYLVLNDLDKADHFSQLAMKAGWNSETIGSIRGAVLVEKGDISEGMKLLFNVMDFEVVSSQTIAAAIYLVQAYHSVGDMKPCFAHLNFVYQHIDTLEADQKAIFDRTLEKTGIQYKPQPV